MLNHLGQMLTCPECNKPSEGIMLFPMSFREIDEAAKTAQSLPASKARGRKRKSDALDIDFDEKSFSSDRRTGRWTNEEMTLCDKLMEKFETGELPITDGIKLNEFLGNMLKSKQSRLTKKMKNAKLSAKSFSKTTGYLTKPDAVEFSAAEEAFFRSISDAQDRAEIKFHMQKEWREHFSRLCAESGQSVEGDAWLSSVEEMDRRASKAKDAARMAKRKLMMGVALKTDADSLVEGIFIERTSAEAKAMSSNVNDQAEYEDEILNLLADGKTDPVADGKSSMLHAAPFLNKAVSYLKRHNVPFEHIDLWVPSYVSNEDLGNTCRLCYAGSATTGVTVDTTNKLRDLTPKETFNFNAFGDYSQKFSFDVGCGLPGRVYESGRPTWEQGVHNAPASQFERHGGAMQWNIRTVLGIPVASPNVGRIVVTLYSALDRPKDEELVSRLSEEFTRLLPSPKWKLVVDIGDDEVTQVTTAAPQIQNSHLSQPFGLSEEHEADDPTKDAIAEAIAETIGSADHDPEGGVDDPFPPNKDPRVNELISLLGEHMPSEHNSNTGSLIPGFTSLRLLLLRQAHTPSEQQTLKTVLDSYSSYSAGGRSRFDIAVMLVRDFLFLTQHDTGMSTFVNHHAHSDQLLPFLSLGGSMAAADGHASQAQGSANQSLSLFGLPSTNSSQQNSPALMPIPAPGNDSMSIVSN